MTDVINDEDGLKGVGIGVDMPGARELEVLLAEIENRLRRTILRIIRPTLDQQVDMCSRLDVMTAKVEQHESILELGDKLRQEVRKQAEVVDVLTEQLHIRDGQARSFEKQTLTAISDLRSQEADIETKIEEHKQDLLRGHRESSRIWEDVERNQKEHDEVCHRIWAGVAGCNKRADKIRDEFVSNISDLHKQHEALVHDLYDDGKGLTKIRADLHQQIKFTETLPRTENDVIILQRKVHLLEGRQDECEGFCEKAHKAYKDFTSNCEEKLATMAEEFRDSVNKLVAHHASLMKGMRVDFHTELDAAKKLSDGAKSFESKTEKYIQDIAGDLIDESKRLDSIHRQLVQELDDVKSRRKRERHAHDAELRDVKRDSAIQQEVVSSFHGGLAYLSRVVGLVLEGERVTSALHVQDFADRLGERWLGRPEDLDRHAQPPHTADMLEKLPRRLPGDLERVSGNPALRNLVPVDPRVGLAKLGYAPGRISYGGSQYDRQDMLLLHSKLLQKAHSTFEKGPPKNSVLNSLQDLSVRTAQPSAIGGIGSSHGSVKRVPMGQSQPKKTFGDSLGADEFSEDPKSTAPSSGTQFGGGRNAGSRQRPGSQGNRPGSTGQPQGTGSRGTMFGSLGETEPPPDAYRPEGLDLSAYSTEGAGPFLESRPRPEGVGAPDGRPPGTIGRGSRGIVKLPGIESIGSSTARQPSASDTQESGNTGWHTAR